MKARLKNDELLLDGVDPKRVARNLKNLGSAKDFRTPQSHDEWLDFASQVLGKTSYFELRQQAKNSLSARPDYGSMERHSMGVAFSSKLPSRFDVRWQAQVLDLVLPALEAVKGLPKQLVCVVGKSNSGKTVLLKHLAHVKHGIVFDVAFEGSPYVRHCPGASELNLHIFDCGESHAFRRHEFDNQLAKAFKFPGVPRKLDPVTPWQTLVKAYGDMGGSAGPWEMREPHRTKVVSLPSEDDVPKLFQARIHPGFGGRPARSILDAIYVVNLDEMTMQKHLAPQ